MADPAAPHGSGCGLTAPDPAAELLLPKACDYAGDRWAGPGTVRFVRTFLYRL
jgi:hypothetical protein